MYICKYIKYIKISAAEELGGVSLTLTRNTRFKNMFLQMQLDKMQ